MKRILLAGFAGNDNSSKIILDKCSPAVEKLYLENDFLVCATQIETAINNEYDFILVLGQKPVIKALYIEIAGRTSHDCLKSNFDYRALVEWLKLSGYTIRLSENAGNYLCNHVYYHGLKTVRSTHRNTQIILMHVPYLKNIVDVKHLADTLSVFLLNLLILRLKPVERT